MQIKDIIQVLEELAPPIYQESYDNAGLIVGNSQWECTGIICSLDATEEVVLEAKAKGCNLIVAHHPILFKGIKQLNGKNYVEKTLITAIKSDIAIYAIHTNLDNVIWGVNSKIADQIGLLNRQILVPKAGLLSKLICFAPESAVENIKTALFEAGAGQIGHYSECSFQVNGWGNFKGGLNSQPTIGLAGQRTSVEEVRIEFIHPTHLQKKLVNAMIKAHPYEEVAYDLVSLDNDYQHVGSGILGELPEPMEESTLLSMLQTSFGISVIKHSPFLEKRVQKIAICGGGGSFLIGPAIRAGADVLISADLKYHEFFDANGQILIADIGHWESEQYTTDLLFDILQAKFPTFAVLKSVIKTNPVNYFL
ncbi:MAG: Nif3-like dinuclear metal center hexameric protein [Sphingobacteriia bacterium 39-39-8]|nr:MAG: Nif3-like dinuclear metal center hexameric protein [Sphingobacteriia bacterium 39-39-8]HQR92971.1 Nif3-like dinuclear metal center hexameric protein [Sediminibacterium sp.]